MSNTGSYFSSGFDFAQLSKNFRAEKEKLLADKLSKACSAFEKNVEESLRNGDSCSAYLAVPEDYSGGVRLNIVQELDRRFPQKVQFVDERTGAWQYYPGSESFQKLVLSPTKFRIKFK